MESFHIAFCYSYGDYSNLADLCDYENTHSVVNSLGICFGSAFEVTLDEEKIEEIQALDYTIMIGEEMTRDIVQLPELV